MATQLAEKADSSAIKLYSKVEILRKALEFKGLTVSNNRRLEGSIPGCDVIAIFPLDESVLAHIETHGIKQYPHSEGMFTLADENPSATVEQGNIDLSAYWNLKKDRASIEISVGVHLSVGHQGVLLTPHAMSESGVSPGAQKPHARLFKALVETATIPLPEVVREIAASTQGFVVVPFASLNLGGIREIRDLFHQDFARGNEVVSRLGSSNHKIIAFYPDPHLPFIQSTDRYVAEADQKEILDGWTAQLKTFQDSLTIREAL